ncbi:hypothetical protein D9V32_15965 [Mycetocola tolaasinivorans]|uniref:Peptidoglycan binding-like domain-containing protein n=1 Tax=Mycetocola tolaasinivorans TaxID=76635 RepID=A0A3L6ZW99_9MICO|nr:peptidoglycan-binding protein [Mycetocola tolaasinivorans]RLP71851.1 hypothetical protein D9V32_15965 [Mycetocola tolaasinivorans]
MSGRLRVGALIAVIALAVGALIGTLFLPPLLPVSTAPIAGPRAVPVTERSFDGLHSVAAVPEVSGEVRVPVNGAGGTITASSCAPGHQVTLGEHVLSIDGIPRIAIVTTVPLWRDLRLGLSGTDVSALQQALSDAGQGVAVDGTFGATTAAAVRAVQEASSTEKTGQVVLDRVQWIPAGIGPIASCEAGVGSIVTAGEALLTVGGALIGLSVPASPAELPEHAYSAAAGTSSVPLSAERRVTDPELLQAVSASPAFADWKKDPGRGVSLQVRLVDPIAAIGVPPAAVVLTDPTGGCVVAEDRTTVPVSVLASELGTVFVVAEKPITRVMLPASEVISACE